MTMTVDAYERIDAATPPDERLPHEARYRMAAGWLMPHARVIDAACGTGYGAAILRARGPATYLGVDRDLSVVETERVPGSQDFLAADLETWGGPPDPFDVAVVFETVEHLDDPTALRDWTYRARRLVIVSVPIVPTMGGNPYHKHDYRPGEILTLWKSMKPLAYFEQPFAGTGLWVFGQW